MMHYYSLILALVFLGCKQETIPLAEPVTGGTFVGDNAFDPNIPNIDNSRFISNENESNNANSNEPNEGEKTDKVMSGGEGGKKGETLNGLGHEFSGLSTQYRVWVPPANSKSLPHSLVVYLHGDNGSNFGPANLDPNIIAQFAAHGQDRPTLDQAVFEGTGNAKRWAETIFVSILTPSQNQSSTLTWSTNLTTQRLNNHAAFLHDLVQNKIFTQYNVDLKNVYFAGQSGGAFFLSSAFITQYGHLYNGGAILLCGGEPAVAENQVIQAETLKKNFRVHFETTENEDVSIAQDIVRSNNYYRGLLGEDRVTYVKEGNGVHCIFQPISQPVILDRVISRMQELNN